MAIGFTPPSNDLESVQEKDLTRWLAYREAQLYKRLDELYTSSQALDDQRETRRSKAGDARADGEFHRFTTVLAEYERICGVRRGTRKPTDDDFHAALAHRNRGL